MAGAGFKTFTTGEVLLAADVNTYLMQQTVMVFDDASARATAIPTPSEGMFSYLKDTNLTYRYDGSAWLSDAGTTSPLTTKGDVWGYSTADARVPVGANGTVLTADSAEALGVKWAAPAAGGKVLQVVQGTLTSNASTTSNTLVDTGLTVSITPSSGSSKIYVVVNAYGYTIRTGAQTVLEFDFCLLRGATQLQQQQNGFQTMSSMTSPEYSGPVSFSYLDSPATTSSTTYKIQYRCPASQTLYILANSTRIASIIAMEIGA